MQTVILVSFGMIIIDFEFLIIYEKILRSLPSGTLTAKISESTVSERCTRLLGAIGYFSGSSDSNSKSTVKDGPSFIKGVSSASILPL